jgi:hypothetical protein
MKASGRTLFWIVCAAAVGTGGCQSNDSTGNPGSGGQSSGSGGRSDSASGGSSQSGSGGSASGGSPGSGGIASTGGTTGSGGSNGSGGVASSGGSEAGTGGASGGTTGASGGTTGASGGSSGMGGKGGASAATGGTAGGGGGGAAASGGAGGASAGGWVNITPVSEALKDANGVQWYPYVKGYTPGMDPLKTFRYDASTGYLVVTYADYPNGSFDNHLGLIYYDKKLTNYRVRFEYHFKDPQAKNPPSWGKNNSGLFVFCTDPHMITGNPDFPVGIEIQLAGSPSGGGDVNCQICLNSTSPIYPAKIGSMDITKAGGCFRSMQNTNDFKTQNLAATWVTIETVVSATGTTNVYQYTPDGMKPASPIQTFSAPVKAGSQTVTSQWIALQSESQPAEFRKIELMENP